MLIQPGPFVKSEMAPSQLLPKVVAASLHVESVRTDLSPDAQARPSAWLNENDCWPQSVFIAPDAVSSTLDDASAVMTADPRIPMYERGRLMSQRRSDGPKNPKWIVWLSINVPLEA